MRIISGSLKGRQISAPKNLPVRPTTDRAKESLFNILGNQFDFEGLSVLDLFAGTGNISFEFLSRGARHITAVDSYFKCLTFIKKTSQELEGPIATKKSDVFKFLEKTGGNFDIIFADPPYDFSFEKLQDLVKLVFDKNHLAEEGILVLEHSKQINLSELSYFKENRRYGETVFSFFKHK